MPTSISLLIGHSKELIRAGLRAMLDKTNVEIVGEAKDGPQVARLAKKLKPAVVLMDAAIPGADSFDLVRQLRKAIPATQHVLLTALDNPTYMARARAAGASNCLLKSVTQKQLVSAIEHAAAGKPAPVGAGPFAGVASQMQTAPEAMLRKTNLTPRESQVLAHVALGLSNEEIASSLTISIETVKEHVQNVLRKLDVADRTRAAVWALRSGVA